MTTIKSLVLKNYRNHQTLSLRFGERVNLIVGGNARGKTNILESIYFLGRGRSFRSQDYREIIAWGKADCRIEARLEKLGRESSALAYLDGGRKVFKLDGKKRRSAAEVGVVMFAPQDISIFVDLPQERRRYLNELISGLDKSYRLSYGEYARTLNHRNRVLKEGFSRGSGPAADELGVWNERLLESGVPVVVKRKRWIDEVNTLLPRMYGYMGGVGSQAEVCYRVSFDPGGFGEGEIRASFAKELKEREELERIKGVTLTGPHRDDWSARVSGHELKSGGSQGQMRIVAIALKMAELALIEQIFGDTPVLLLDDVTSELDKESVGRLLNFVGGLEGQVFITSTHQGRLVKNLGHETKVFNFPA